jgi:sodium transport system permease protein
MKNIYNIFKKEFDKIFKFPRAIFSTILLPGLIIFVIYFLIGNVLSNEMENAEERESIIYTINAPESFTSVVTDDIKVDMKETTQSVDELTEQINDGNTDIVIIFQENFDELVRSKSFPKVTILYAKDKMNSSNAYLKVQFLLDLQKNKLLEELDINPNIINPVPTNVAKEGTESAMYLAMIFPMIIMSLIFGSAMGIGSEAIAGEKERGTLAKLLLLPIKRSQIIGGKIMSTTIITILSGTSSFIGVITSLPYMGNAFMPEGGVVGYSFVDYLAIFGLVIILTAFASVLLLIVSTISKNLKESNSYALPIFLVAMFLPIMNMMNMGQESATYLYLIPLLNVSLGFTDLLSMNMDILNYLLIIASNLVVISLLVFFLTRLFKRESVLFSK